jgi:predicted HTH transcriptional regulator
MLNDSDILQKLTNTEDAAVERKVRSDYRDCKKTAVAFANSLPVADPGIIFVGVYDNGTVENDESTEKLQMKISQEIDEIYPPVFPQVLTREKDGKKFIVVIVYGSIERPHFAGPAYIRKDSQSVRASDQQFSALIASRNSKTNEILKWKDKVVTVETINIEELRRYHRVATSHPRIIRDCNQFFVTLEEPTGNGNPTSFSLRRVEINYDHVGQSLALEIYPY